MSEPVSLPPNMSPDTETAMPSMSVIGNLPSASSCGLITTRLMDPVTFKGRS